MFTYIQPTSIRDGLHTQHTVHKSNHDHTFTLQHPKYGVIGGCTIQPMDTPLQQEIQNTFNLPVPPQYSWLVSDLYFDLSDEIMDGLNDQHFKTLMLDFYRSLYTVLEQTSQTHNVPYYCCIMQTSQYRGAKQLGLIPLGYGQRWVQGDDDLTLSFLIMADDRSETFYQHQQLERQAQQLTSSVVH